MTRSVQGETCGARHEKLSIEVTTRCNSECAYCFARSGRSDFFELPLGLVREIIAEGYATGYRRLHITGGEPFLWEGLFQILDDAVAMGYATIFVNTNGTLLDKIKSARLAAYNGLTISVSLDGPQSLHDRFRGKGTFRRAFRGLEMALSEGVGAFLFAVASKSLTTHLTYFARDMYRRLPDLKSLTLIPLVYVQGESWDLADEILEPEDFLTLVRTAALLNLSGLKTDFLNEPLVNVVSKLMGMPWVPLAYPLYREDSMIIMANRDIRLAHSDRRSFARYNCGILEKMLESEAYRNAVAPDDITCISCNYYELCRVNGILRPSAPLSIGRSSVPFCRHLLDGITARFRGPQGGGEQVHEL